MSDAVLRADIVKTLRDFEDDIADALLRIAKQAFELGEAAANPALLNRAREAEAERDASVARAEEAERAAGRYTRLYNSTISKRDAVHALFAGGPDTPCRTTWRDGIECVEVPMEDLRRALDAPVERPSVRERGQ